MLLPRPAVLWLVAVFAFAFSQSPVDAVAQENANLSAREKLSALDVPPPDCHVTLPSDGGGLPSKPLRATRIGIGAEGMVGAYGTDTLSTFLPIDGVWRGQIPQKPGDFAYENKLPWRGKFLHIGGSLIVKGRRPDGPAPSFI
jgi:hypothetical protein